MFLFTLNNPTEEGRFVADLTGQSAFRTADEIYTTRFTELNGSGVSGVAVIGYDVQTDRIFVSIQAEGLEPGQAHIQHIHGFMADENGVIQDSVVPTLANDTDGDGFVELGEGAPVYGGILLTLANDNNNGNGNFNPDQAMTPMPDADGSLDYFETFRLPEQDLGEDPMLALREIVLHGLTLDEGDGANGGEADGTAGYKATLPVAAGSLELTEGTDAISQSIAGFYGTDPIDDDRDAETIALGEYLAELTGADTFADADEFFFGGFAALNMLGADGNAIVGFDEDTGTLTVAIRAEGIEPGQSHIQHIHGFMEDEMGNEQDAQTPTLADDTDGDGFIELGEGAPVYGGILLTLGDDDGNAPVAGADGSYYYVQTFTLPEADLEADPTFENYEIVVHGVFLEEGEGAGEGEADGTEGYKAVLPAMAAELNEVESIDEFTAFLAVDAFGQGDLNTDAGLMVVDNLLAIG